MSQPNLNPRLEELLIEQAVFGLTSRQQTELEQLQSPGTAQSNPFEETVALVQLGLAAMDQQQGRSEPMPEGLRRKLQKAAKGNPDQT